MTRQWTLNASPFIVLGKAGLLGTISPLADTWFLPEGVIIEVEHKHSAHAGIAELERTSRVEQIRDIVVPPEVAAWDLGRGESEVLAIALNCMKTGVVLDDLQARKCASVLGVTLKGTLGLLIEAKRLGMLKEAKPAIQQVQAVGLYIDPQLLQQIFLTIGES